MKILKRKCCAEKKKPVFYQEWLQLKSRHPFLILLIYQTDLVRAGVAENSFRRVIQFHTPPAVNAATVGLEHLLPQPDGPGGDFHEFVLADKLQ